MEGEIVEQADAAQHTGDEAHGSGITVVNAGTFVEQAGASSVAEELQGVLQQVLAALAHGDGQQEKTAQYHGGDQWIRGDDVRQGFSRHTGVGHRAARCQGMQQVVLSLPVDPDRFIESDRSFDDLY